MINPAEFDGDVFHYSIPTVEETGAGMVESASDLASAKLHLQGGEVLISKLNPRKGRVLISRPHALPVVASPEFIALRVADSLVDRFLEYVLCAETTRQYLDSCVQSVTRSHQRVTPELVRRISIALPSVDEQRRIADFLDIETNKIDGLINQCRAHQGLLDERSTGSLIHSMIGKQDGWGRTRLKYLFASRRNGLWGDEPTGGADDLICVRVADFQRDDYRASLEAPTLRSIPAAVARERMLQPGDILLEKSGGGEQSPVGFAVMFDNPARSVCSNFVACLRVAEGVDPRYACLVLAAYYRAGRNLPYIKQATGIQNLDSGAYLAQEVRVPNQRGQALIAQRFDQELEQAIALRSYIDHQIYLLVERRQTIITAAVTGQIDVTTARGITV